MTFDLNDLPSYRDLPAKEGAPTGSSWGLFGDDDQLGTLNLLTPERVASAARLIRKGAVFPLNLRIDKPSPPLYGRGAPRQTMTAGANGRDDYLDNFWPQASSQWDSLRHIRHPRDGFYNRTPDDAVVAGGGRLGIENMAQRGIAGRGVLLDVARHFSATDRTLDQKTDQRITAEDLAACARAHNVEIRTGDILLIRTGWLTWYFNTATPAEREQMADRVQLRAPGLAAGEEMAAYLWDLHIAAIAADNPALEAWPPREDSGGFLHFHLIPLLGMPIGELWWLDALAEDCAGDRVYEFFFTSAPLNVPGGVGSPPNALAIK
ncbi:MAG: cyclase family protein [Chloroflexi bacterium]|nr:cyclase family protein [Chloroflexota bacterium]